VVDDSPSFDKEQDLYPNIDHLREKLDRFRIKVKREIQVRIKVLQIRNPDLLSCYPVLKKTNKLTF
jgi:hypothetical protein